jgi:serine protease Do
MVVILMHQQGYAAFGGFGDQRPVSFADLANSVKHSVVNISTTKVVKGHPLEPFMNPESPFRDFFGDEFFKRFFGDSPQREMRTSSLGSGVVIDRDGLILTNNHVVEKADEIKVKLDTGKEYDAQVVGRDPKTDLALIRVKPDSSFPNPTSIGDSDAMQVGDWVIAVGNPFGLGHTVTSGIVSAKGRVIGAGPYDDFIQTDAAINPGNSGGPLFNMKGEVIGINTAIVAQGQGIGFAIPINVAKEIMPQLKEGKVIRGWLGVMIQDVTPELAKSFNLEKAKGVLVADVVQGGPAEKSGLQQGDIVTGLNGKQIENAQMLSRSVAALPPDSQASLTIIRDGKEQQIKVAIGTMPEDAGLSGKEPAQKESAWGIEVQNITPEMAQRFGWDANERGVVITSVDPASPAGRSKLAEGDLIKEVNRQKIGNLRDYKQALSKSSRKDGLLLLVKRGDRTFYAALSPSGEEQE